MKEIRWGIIGTGGIARVFAKEIALVEGSKITAICTRTLEKGQEFIELFGQVEVYTDYAKMLEESDVDAVYISTPHTFHKDHTIQALNSGKAVMCEKPMGMNAHEVEAMVDVAKKNKVLLMEAMWTRFLPAVKKAKALIEEGLIGDVRLFKADFCYFLKAGYPEEGRLLNPKLGGGSKLDVGIYAASFMEYMLGGAPNEIHSDHLMRSSGVDDACAWICKYDYSMAIIYSGICALTEREAFIGGTKGHIRMPLYYESDKIIVTDEEGKSEVLDFPRENHGFVYEIEAFSESCRKGELQNDIMPLQSSIEVAKILDCV